MTAIDQEIERPLMADCRPPFKASNFSINDCGMARYATLKPTLAWITKDL
jgi:hypothetical protein